MTATVLTVVAMILFWWSLGDASDEPGPAGPAGLLDPDEEAGLDVPPTSTHVPRSNLDRWGPHAMFVAAAALGGVLVLSLDVHHLRFIDWVMQGGAVLLLLIGAWWMDRLAEDRHQSLRLRPAMSGRLEASPGVAMGGLGAILLGAVAVRVWNLHGLPFGFWFDEADVGMMARKILNDPTWRPIFVAGTELDPLPNERLSFSGWAPTSQTIRGGIVPAWHAYLVAALSWAFGESVATIRMVSVFFGVGTVAAAYLVGRELLGRSAGLLFAALMAFGRWPISLSRIAMFNVTVPFFGLTMLGFMLRGWRRKSTLDWVIAGLAAGAGMLFYSAMAGTVLAVAAFGAIMAVTSPERLRWTLPRIVGAVLAALVVVAPLAMFALTETDTYLDRQRVTSLWGNVPDADGRWEATKQNLRAYLGMTHWEGDGNGRHNLPGEPMVSSVVAGLSLLGLAAAARKRYWPLLVLAAVWLPFGWLPGALSLPFEAPNSLRAVGVQPVVFLLAASALAALSAAAGSAVRALSVIWLTAVATCCALLLGWHAVVDVRTYFGPQADDFGVWAQHSTRETIAGRLVAEAPPSTDVWSVGFFQGQKTMEWFTQNRPVDQWFDTDTQLPFSFAPGKDVLILTVPDSLPLVEQTRQLYPEATVKAHPVDNFTELFEIRIPAHAVAAAHAAGPQLVDQDGEAWVTATLIADRLANYVFRIPDRPSSIVVDGQVRSICAAETEPLVLGPGLHTVAIRADDASVARTLEWRHQGIGQWEPIPVQNLLAADRLAGGLLARRYSGEVAPESGAADPSQVLSYAIDSNFQLRWHALPSGRPYTTVWSGAILIPDPGDYRFVASSDDETEVRLDQQLVSRVSADGQTDQSLSAMEVTGGWHDFSITYVDRDGGSRLKLEWQTAQGVIEPIPATQLWPGTSIPTDLGTCNPASLTSE